MSKLITLRWALPAIIVLIVATLLAVGLLLLTHQAHAGNAWEYPCC